MGIEEDRKPVKRKYINDNQSEIQSSPNHNVETIINTEDTPQDELISHTCFDNDGNALTNLQSGEKCYLYCKSLTETDEAYLEENIGSTSLKVSRISCGTGGIGQRVNCSPDELRTPEDMCPHTHDIFLQCGNRDIDVTFTIDPTVATGFGVVSAVGAIFGYLLV